MSKRISQSFDTDAKRIRREDSEPQPDPRNDVSLFPEDDIQKIDTQELKMLALPSSQADVQFGKGLPELNKASTEDKQIIELVTINKSKTEVNRFNTDEYKQTVEVKFNLPKFDKKAGTLKTIQELTAEIDNLYERLIGSIIEEGMKEKNKNGEPNYTEEDYYSVAIRIKLLKHKPFFIKPKKIKLFKESHEEFSNAASRVFQSNEDFIFKNLEFTVYLTKSPVGKGSNRVSSKKRAPIDQKENSKRKMSVITIKNEDNSCGYRGVFIGSKWLSEGFGEIEATSPRMIEWRKIIGKGTYSDKYQREGTKVFLNDANDYLHNWYHSRDSTKCDLPCPYTKRFDYNKAFGSEKSDFEDMNLYLCSLNQCLVVINAGDVNNLLFRGQPAKENDPAVHIQWQEEGHFNYIPNIVKYKDTRYFCRACYKAHWSTNHRCEYVCQVCGGYPKCKEGETVDCEACGVTFINQKCYSNHLKNTTNNSGPLCLNRKRCDNCKCYYQERKGNKHVCGEYKCKTCFEKYTETPHYCMLKPLDISKLIEEDNKNKIIVTFDIEAMVETGATGEDLHIPNLLISETVCDICWDENSCQKMSSNCKVCGVGKHVFVYSEPIGVVGQFADYLYKDLAKQAETNKSRIIVFAHNSKGYDGHFIMQDLFKRKFSDQPQIILQGLKVLKIGVNNIDFIDSLSFFQQPLASLPKSFGFESVVEKGFFPHCFNKPGRWGYRGPIPDLKEFGLKFMSDKAAKDCTEWHRKYQDSGKEWVFSYELFKYCENDVRILTMAVMEFRKLFKSVTDLDPITRNFTLASVAMEHFRSSVLQENQIGITPIDGYIPLRNKSKSANIWLDWHQKQLNEEIIREFKIGPYYVDGFHKKSNTIYEFFGCFYHGCDVCFANDRSEEHPMLAPKTFDSLFNETSEKIDYFEQKGYNLTKIWEHDYNQECKTKDSLNKYYMTRLPYYQTIHKYGHINIRDAFFGGRTNNLYFSHICAAGEVIKYLDVTSLYPSVLVKNPYPIGHPRVITEFNGTDISNYFGFVKCKVSPPKNLYIPVLPFRDQNKKLLFPLCGICASNKIQNCNHTELERRIVGTWFTEEMKLALSKGYIITDIYEVLHYERKSDALFKPYIQSWLKLKTEASGWPSSCHTEEKKQEFIEEFKQREGVELELNQIEKNSGRRFISKLMLNSFWGKLGQRRNQGQTTICTNYSQFYNLISDAKIDIKGMLRIDEETFLVSHCFTEDSYDRAGNTNIAIAAMVTGYARIKLYTIIDSIESSQSGRTLYFDTDSVIFVDKPDCGWANPEIGDFLGDMTDEIAKDYGPTAYIDKFTSGGPKNYAYSVKVGDDHKYVTKIKGMNISHGIKDVLNFDCVREHAEKYRSGDKDACTIVDQLQFSATNLHQVSTNIFPKKYRAVSDKRVVLPEGTRHTIPFGYQNN